MWPWIALNDQLRIWFLGTLCGQRTMNTFAYRVSRVEGANVDADVAVEALLADTQFTDLVASFVACTPTNYTLDAIEWQYRKPNGFLYAKQRIDQGTAGTRGAATTANIQASITRRPLIADRVGVGGIRLPISNTDVNASNGLITQALKDLLNVVALDMSEEILTVPVEDVFVDWKPCTIRHVIGTGFVHTDVAEAFVQDQVRVLRRRTVGLGI